ncbi:unnamed protein product [Heligmosomoides polygyrus]|uniref:Lipid-binding serum glycoprotein C-terminal domain-containing protein n=1 Tax=Heligmosomoides polygyrus TaxID=6339 RepID=A0A3P8HBV3_HELPZ|nr:unnamed protein product [Heligmosomoides polygyrus]
MQEHFECSTYISLFQTQPRGITSFIRSLRTEYEEALENHSIPTIRKKRCLGKVELTDIVVTNVDVELTESVVSDGDYHLRIEHLHARLHGNYRHNVLILENTGDFQLNVRDLNASLGPLVPINIGGIPYLNQEISCSIWHSEDKIEVTGGILRWLARKRLRDTMKEDLEGILCDSLVGILDGKIRKTLAGLKLLLPVNEVATMSYLLIGQPLLLPYGAVRTYHSGVTSPNHQGAKFAPSTIHSRHHAIYHIHEGLLSEAVQSACSQSFFDGNITTGGGNVQISCQKASIAVRNMEALNTANLMMTLLLTLKDGSERLVSKNYAVTILHRDHHRFSSRLRILFRLKSEIVNPNDRLRGFNDEIFSILAEVMRSHVSLPLPIPDGAHTNGSMIKLLSDRIIFATDFVFKER